MILASGVLHKMSAVLDGPVRYRFRAGEDSVELNSLFGRRISFSYRGEIYCIQCARRTQKTFQQGYCFPCYRRLLECGLCLIHPERCLAEEGVCDPTDWAHAACLAPHIVYLANSSQLKVGITRLSNVPSRWIDQGAVQGLPLFQTANRRQAGLIEIVFKAHVRDKTHWRAMLKADPPELDLLSARRDVMSRSAIDLEPVLSQFADEVRFLPEAVPTEIRYPVSVYPSKVVSLSFEPDRSVSGILVGIKGQYVMLDVGVLSVRKFLGYHINFSAD